MSTNIEDEIIVNVVERGRNRIPRRVTLAYRDQNTRLSFVAPLRGKTKAILTHQCGTVSEEVLQAMEQKATQCLQPD